MDTTTRERWPHQRYVATEQPARRLVVADDEPDVRRVVTVALRGLGFDIIQASDGTELLAKARGEPCATRTGGSPDIIIADIRMPGLSGLEVLAALRQDHLCVPVVLVSAQADFETRVRASELGAAAFFAKPFDVHELVTAVLNLTPRPTGSRGE
jgi:DNA-binding response OmpR family regulator